MEDNKTNKTTVRLTEVNQKEGNDNETSTKDSIQKLKKPIIFGLMAIVFLGCMYLIFIPSSDIQTEEQIGLNEMVPQSTEAEMQGDKGKAYESDLLEQKELEKKKSLSSLSDYWNPDSTTSSSGVNNSAAINPGSNPAGPALNHHVDAVKSYQNIQGTLGNFYEDRSQTDQLQNEVKSLRAQLLQKESTPANPVPNQLELMEKSYQMAAKYFPVTGNSSKPDETIQKKPKDSSEGKTQNISFAALYPVQNNTVSALYRAPSDSMWLADLARIKNRNFYTAGIPDQPLHQSNSIRACIHETQTITADQSVRIRLLDAVRLSKLVIRKGTVVTAIAKFQGNRLQLQVSSIEYEGSIIPVDVKAYDLDGQTGLSVPYSPERSALTEMAVNMGNTGGTSISLSSNAGQQITSDLSKSVVQGISGYFSKKVRMPKITLKAGYQVFLVAKK